jgi:hypothetical protein
LKDQVCPFDQGTGVNCGDWCPLFGEPFRLPDMPGVWETATLRICDGRQLRFGVLEDRRETTEQGEAP